MPDIIITIGAGRGGIDGGTAGDNGLLEKNCTLAAARGASKILQETGRFDVRLLRDADYYLSDNRRGKLAAKLNSGCHVEICFGSSQNSGTGVKVFYSAGIPGDEKPAAEMARKIASALKTESCGSARQSEMESAGFAALADAAVKGGVVHIFAAECGINSFLAASELLTQQKAVDVLAEAVASSVCEMYGVKPPRKVQEDLMPSAEPEKQSPPESKEALPQNEDTVKPGAYYIREKPEHMARVIGLVTGGAKIRKLESVNGFSKILFGGTLGFVINDALESEADKKE